MIRKIAFLLLILFIGISAVSASDNGTDFKAADLNDTLDGYNPLNDDLLCENEINSSDDNESGESDNGLSQYNESIQDNNSENSSDIHIESKDLTWYFKGKPVFKFRLVDSNNQSIAGERVQLVVRGNYFYATTDENGYGSLKFNSKPGRYTVAIKYGNLTVKNKVILFSSRISSKNINSVYGTKVKYLVRVLDNSGRAMAGAKVTYKIGKKTFHRYTNSKGYAVLELNFNSGTYKVKYSVDNVQGSNIYKVNNKIAFQILKWGLKGDISKVASIKSHMPKNYWVKKAVLATKKGIPFFMFKGGNGKTVFMTAGVHGNEMCPQISAMYMIKYLSENPIDGTVYFIPFVNVKAISEEVRLTEYDFNRVAHVPGTVSNKIINLVLKLKCDSYGDFHSTESPGVPGENIILGFQKPKSSIPLTNYLAKQCKVKKLFYEYPGEVYQWSLADWCNYHRVPAVICEVICDVSKVYSKPTSLSYRMMSSFLRYNSLI